jgi:hypothetical protein
VEDDRGLTNRDALADLAYLAQILCWMGGNRAWPDDVVCEQVDAFEDRRVRADIARAEASGMLLRSTDGIKLSDLGWEVASDAA